MVRLVTERHRVMKQAGFFSPLVIPIKQGTEYQKPDDVFPWRFGMRTPLRVGPCGINVTNVSVLRKTTLA